MPTREVVETGAKYALPLKVKCMRQRNNLMERTSTADVLKSSFPVVVAIRAVAHDLEAAQVPERRPVAHESDRDLPAHALIHDQKRKRIDQTHVHAHRLADAHLLADRPHERMMIDQCPDQDRLPNVRNATERIPLPAVETDVRDRAPPVAIRADEEI